jgi:uncharacterized protein YegL
MPNYAENTVQRQQCMLVLDASMSMGTKDADSGLPRIELLNRGIQTLNDELRNDEKALVRVQIAAVVVGGVKDNARIIMDWTDGVDFAPFTLKAGSRTPLGAGMLLALQMIEEQKKELRSHGITYHRPWMFVLTDGEPTDTSATWQEACKATHEAEAAKKVLIYSIGVGEFNFAKLAELTAEPPRVLKGMNFHELFKFVSSSIKAGQIERDPWVAVKRQA